MFRLGVLLSALALAAGTVWPASAQPRDPASLMNVDLPAPNTSIVNGQWVDVGGWSAGSRVDVYLDGVAGVGQAIGTAQVAVARPDVAAARHDSKLANAGFNVGWFPVTVPAGQHTLYVYSLVDGGWIYRTVTVVGLGNIYDTVDPRQEPVFD